ncbi:MAG: glycosyl hydrolase family protein [Ruminococcaceae bacterium]|nr:glycosyl hydrolase family protein [Oscillospiraceae bacterium]
MAFPKNFLWGTATSAGQIEGGALDDGRTPSIWDTLATKPGRIHNNSTPAVACDSYHKFDRDLKNLIDLGVNSYRFSISWSRVMPNGVGPLNDKGMDYYKRVIEQLNKNNITPNVTLYHWDLPQVLEDRGGWVNRDSIQWFGEYADKMFRAFGDVVPMWSTINEPIATYVGYAHGGFAPGHRNECWGNQARHNILVAHGKGVEAFRALNLKDSKIGVVIDIWKRHALTDSPEDIALMIDEDERNWKFYTDPILAGRYSDYILEHLEKEGTLMKMEPHDFELTGQPLDYFGLNVYNRVTVTRNEQARLDFSQGGNFLNNRNEYYPKAVYDAIHLLHDLYDIKYPIYVTENGTFFEGTEPVAEDGMIHDDDRIRYVAGFLEWLEKAIDEGYDVRGYYLWSLMDNFEWTAAYNFKFGIMSTDFATGNVTWKKSAYFYRDFIKAAIERSK